MTPPREEEVAAPPPSAFFVGSSLLEPAQPGTSIEISTKTPSRTMTALETSNTAPLLSKHTLGDDGRGDGCEGGSETARSLGLLGTANATAPSDAVAANLEGNLPAAADPSPTVMGQNSAATRVKKVPPPVKAKPLRKSSLLQWPPQPQPTP